MEVLDPDLPVLLDLTAEFDAVCGWAKKGYYRSPSAWLREDCRVAKPVAGRLVALARRLGEIPAVREAIEDGLEFLTELARLEQVEFDKDWADARNRLGDTATAADLARTPRQRRADALVIMAQRTAWQCHVDHENGDPNEVPG